MRTFVVDTLATIVFFTAFATLSELIIAGMDPGEVLATRLLMVPIMMLTGRPYTGWRDWLFARTKPARPLTTALVDIGAFLTFQAPVYAVTLLIAGASFAEMVTAIAAAIVFMIALARPFGLFVDLVRRLFGVRPKQV